MYSLRVSTNQVREEWTTAPVKNAPFRHCQARPTTITTASTAPYPPLVLHLLASHETCARGSARSFLYTAFSTRPTLPYFRNFLSSRPATQLTLLIATMGIFDKKHGGEKVDETADLPAYERDHSLDVQDGLFENAGMRRCRGCCWFESDVG